ncbi:MAG TPA: ketol-acid reductoisomerase [Thermoanaerobaculia bacterium]|jgi:ketol-acid reductoisomerase|nr:ketol-acid reductoisomerase [Thermoanaerobaculia bacterium]
MPAKIYYDQHADPTLLADAKVAIIGYGSQGHAHALNLHDSGIDVRVGLPETSASRAKATAAGLPVMSVAEAAHEADVVVVLVPDPKAGEVYRNHIAGNLKPGAMLLFAHGFAVRYGEVVAPPEVDVTMVAPKCPGHRLRELYEQGEAPPALIAVAQDATGRAHGRALAYAHALGCTRAGVLETTFAEETETDLFGEQAVLCGGVSALVQAGFETLVEAGYQPEIAYFECLHELKLIVDLIYRGGLSFMRYSISDTAEYGDYTAGPKVVNAQTRDTMRALLARIQNGEFAKEWLDESRAGAPRFHAWRAQGRIHPIEEVGRQLRGMMPWLAAAEAPAAAAPRPPAAAAAATTTASTAGAAAAAEPALRAAP